MDGILPVVMVYGTGHQPFASDTVVDGCGIIGIGGIATEIV